MIERERASLVDALAVLPAADWGRPSLCAGRTVRDVVGHLIATASMTPPRFFAKLAGSGFNFDRMTGKEIERVTAGRTDADLVASMRSLVSARTGPPGPATSWLGETIVHGDYRLDNCVLDAGDPSRIIAVLDWEMSTLGDPLADLGLLLTYWHDRAAGELAGVPIFAKISDLDGMPARGELAELYAGYSGRDLSSLSFYVAFGYFKLAVVVHEDGVERILNHALLQARRRGEDLSDLDQEP